jgi:hypothetical protein
MVYSLHLNWGELFPHSFESQRGLTFDPLSVGLEADSQHEKSSHWPARVPDNVAPWDGGWRPLPNLVWTRRFNMFRFVSRIIAFFGTLDIYSGWKATPRVFIELILAKRPHMDAVYKDNLFSEKEQQSRIKYHSCHRVTRQNRKIKSTFREVLGAKPPQLTSLVYANLTRSGPRVAVDSLRHWTRALR